MSVVISIIVSVLALLLTVYQMHLQRVHNQQSVKPYAQIELIDQHNVLSVRLHNNGLGPLIVSGFTFQKNSVSYSTIEDCLTLDPKSYWHVTVNDAVQRIILPNTYLTVFDKKMTNHAETEKDKIRKQLSLITLHVHYRDVYNRSFNTKRNFEWFARHFQVKTPKP